MKLSLTVYALLLVLCSEAQEGIVFANNLSWEQVKAAAKKQQKYIFVDCYATWCGPCKLMDKEVYPIEKVGKFMNAKFISVKLQMDSTLNDKEAVRQWYQVAHTIKQENKVGSYPTFLYYSPEGKLVHRFSGAIRDTDFINVSADALDPQKQYYTLLNNYKSGKKDFSKMRYLTRFTNELGNNELASKIALDYMNNYLSKNPNLLLLSEKDLAFANAWFPILSSRHTIFQYFVKNADAINSKLKIPSSAQKSVVAIIIREEKKEHMSPYELSGIVRKKHGAYYAQAVRIDQEYVWFASRKDTAKMVSSYLEGLDFYGLDTVGLAKFLANNTLFSLVFKSSENKQELIKAAAWAKKLAEASPGDAATMDTYANLLYKAGENEKAIAAQQQAVEFENTIARVNNQTPDPQYAINLAKMKNNYPTW